MSAEEAGRIARAAERVRRGTRMPLKVLLPTVAALGAGGGFAAASIPGSNGVITACYSTLPAVQFNDSFTGDTTTSPEFLPSYGSLRVIDPSAAPGTVTLPLDSSVATTGPEYNNACAPWEKTITWNQQGPPGVPGPPGKDGTNGSNGANGQNASFLGAATFEIDAGGGTDLFGKFTSISGAVTIKGEQNALKLDSFAFGATSPVSNSAFGSGAGAGKVSIQSFEITKKIDKSSPVLFKDLETGKAIQKLEVDADHAALKGAPVQVATYLMSNVRLKSIKQHGAEETIIGVFQKMQSSIGTGSNKVQTQLNPTAAAGWDVAKNQPAS